jgi:hypothetical protein
LLNHSRAELYEEAKKPIDNFLLILKV